MNPITHQEVMEARQEIMNYAKRFAETIAPYFALCGWQWYIKGNVQFPTVEDMVETIEHLSNMLTEGRYFHIVSTGRIQITMFRGITDGKVHVDLALVPEDVRLTIDERGSSGTVG